MAEGKGLTGRRVKRLLLPMMAMVAMGGTLFGLAAPATATGRVGYACGYYTNVGLFGGSPVLHGCNQKNNQPATANSPKVTLPSGGSSTAVGAFDGDGAISVYGLGTIFSGPAPANENDPYPPSGSLSVSTQGISQVTSQTTVLNVGPQQFTADSVFARCTASPSSHTWTATIQNGVIVTSTDQDGNTLTSEPVPNPTPANYTVHGTVNSVPPSGDSFDIVLNEHIANADGTFTVNGAHMYLLGPTAVGEMVIAQAKCGM